MNFITVHNNYGINLVNLRTVSCIFPDGEGSKICFDGEEFLRVNESVDEIAAMIEKAEGGTPE